MAPWQRAYNALFIYKLYIGPRTRYNADQLLNVSSFKVPDSYTMLMAGEDEFGGSLGHRWIHETNAPVAIISNSVNFSVNNSKEGKQLYTGD